MSIVSASLCFALIFNVCAFATEAAPASIIENIEINEVRGILKGAEVTMTAETEGGSNSAYSLTWGTSDKNIISCTKNGIIRGLKSESYADITCKANSGYAEDTVRVYCVEPVTRVESTMNSWITTIYAQPGPGKIADIHFDFSSIFSALRLVLWFMVSHGIISVQANEFSLLDIPKVTVLGRYGKYCYIRYDEEKFGYVEYTKLSKKIDGYIYLPYSDVDVWGNGKSYPNKIVNLTKLDGVRWTVGDEEIIDFNETTGQITGKKPGQTTLTATKNGISEVIYIHSLYQWPQSWTGKALQETCVYYANENTYTETATELSVGDDFVVLGDTGGDDGWAYGYFETGSKKEWGYVPISHISTKGTISQYNSLDWLWPVVTANGKNPATYISSPYGWRDTDPARHKGVDITNGVSSNSDFANSIDGYEVVSAFAGTVIYVYDISSGYKSCGNCVAIRSNEKDPITGKYYVAIYMHLKSKPNVKRNQEISANTLLGYVGNTGNSGGSHLHFEVNNQNLSYGQKIYYENDSDKEMVFGSVINPLFFYMTYYNLSENDSGKISVNPTCDAMDYRKPLWYGDDIKESKKP